MEKLHEGIVKSKSGYSLSISRRHALWGALGISAVIFLLVLWRVGTFSTFYNWVYRADTAVKVISSDTDKPVAEATITLTNSKNQDAFSASSDNSGAIVINNMVAGDYAAVIKANGFLEYTQSVSLKRGSNDFGTWKLKPIPPIEAQVNGIVRDYISEIPLKGASVTIGNVSAKTNEQGQFIFETIVAGDYTATVTANGYNDLSQKIKILEKVVTLDPFSAVPAGKLVFVSNSDKGKNGIYTANYDGSDKKALVARVGDNEDFSPVISPDHKYVAFISTRENKRDSYNTLIAKPYIVGIDGQNITKLSDNAANSLSWSKDSARVFWGEYSPTTGSIVTVYNLGAKNKVTIGAGKMSGSFVINDAGTKIAFTSYLNNLTGVYIVNNDGSNEIRVSEKNSSVTRFRSDNELIYTVYEDNATKYYSYSVSANTSADTQYDTSKRENTVTSPSGKIITYTDNRDGKSNIFTANTDGTGEKKLTTIDTAQPPVAWTINGKYITFISAKTAETAFYIVGIEGGTAKKVVDTSTSYGYGRDGGY